jgi:branched-chain amino acid aminotransferase
LYGDGVFEGISIYAGRIFRLDEHVRRLYESAKMIQLSVPLTEQELRSAILETARTNKLRVGYLRPIVTRGIGRMGLNPKNCHKPTTIIIPQRPEDYSLLGAGKTPARAIVASIRRNSVSSLPGSAKTLNYLNNILAKLQASYAGVEEAIMLDERGFISEATGENVFLVRRNRVLTPPLEASVLPGVTREVILAIARQLNLPAEERDLTVHDLYNADEAFMSSTSVEIQPLIEIDGRTIGQGEGPITKSIRQKFDEIKKSEGTPVF